MQIITKIHLAVDSLGMPVRFLVTEGAVADCRKALELIGGMEPVIPPKRNRKEQRPYDRHIYRQRHLVENAFAHLKSWRGIATRYCKRPSPLEAAVQIRCISLYLHIS